MRIRLESLQPVQPNSCVPFSLGQNAGISGSHRRLRACCSSCGSLPHSSDSGGSPRCVHDGQEEGGANRSPCPETGWHGGSVLVAVAKFRATGKPRGIIINGLGMWCAGCAPHRDSRVHRGQEGGCYTIPLLHSEGKQSIYLQQWMPGEYAGRHWLISAPKLCQPLQNRKNTPDRLELMKYNPNLRRCVLVQG
jgi:hypothetical protein